MAHCGYEGTAVDDTFAHPLKALGAFLRGPRIEGDMAPEVPLLYTDRAETDAVLVPVEGIAHRERSSAA